MRENRKTRVPTEVAEPLEWERVWVDAMLRATIDALLRERRERRQPPERKTA